MNEIKLSSSNEYPVQQRNYHSVRRSFVSFNVCFFECMHVQLINYVRVSSLFVNQNIKVNRTNKPIKETLEREIFSTYLSPCRPCLCGAVSWINSANRAMRIKKTSTTTLTIQHINCDGILCWRTLGREFVSTTMQRT